MATLKEIGDDKLTEIVKRELPHISHDGFFVWEGTITEDEFTKILGAIKRDKCIEDALQFFGEKYKGRKISSPPMRDLVGYEIIYPVQTETVQFQVVERMTMGPSISYLGHIFTYDRTGHEVRQGTIADIHLI